MTFGKKHQPTPKEDRLPFFRFMAWKSSDIASAVCVMIVTTYLTVYCTDFLGLSPAVVGTVLLVSNIIDFFTDFIGAVIVDNTNTKWGRGRPYELSILGIAVCTILMFSTPNSWSSSLKIAWLFFTYTFAFGVFYTLRTAAANPYTLGAWPNKKVLAKVSSYSGLVVTLCSMVVSVSFPVMMGKLATSASGWLPLVAMYVVPFTAFGLLRFFLIKEDTSAYIVETDQKVTVNAIVELIRKNKYVLMYTGIVLLFNTVTNLGVSAYYWKYVVGNTSLMGVMSVFSILMLPLTLVFPALLKKISAAQLIGGSAAIAALGYLITFFAKDNIPMLIFAALLTGLVTLPISYMGILIIMELANFNKHLGLPGMEATLGAVCTGFGTQIGQGLGSAVSGALLTLAGYVASESDALVTQPDSAIMMIRCLYSLVPMVLMIAIVVCSLALHKLHKRMPEIEEELAAKHTAQ